MFKTKKFVKTEWERNGTKYVKIQNKGWLKKEIKLYILTKTK